MQKETNVSHGLKWGIIIGLVYCVLLFVRYQQGETNPTAFALWTFLGYVIILILLLLSGFIRRRSLGGLIDLKDAFQAMFITVIGFEFFYMAFNFIYLKFINPDFFVHFKSATEAIMQKANMTQAQIDGKLKSFDVESTKQLNLGVSFLSFAFNIMISGVFAMIFALVIRQKPNPFNPNQQEQL